MRPSEIIREAKNVLFERGWYQGDFDGEDGSVCAMGAINVAEGRLAHNCDQSEAENILGRLVQSDFGVTWTGIWNDDPSTTFDDVIAVFDKAEKLAEQAEK